MSNGLTTSEESQLAQTVEMFEVITQTQPQDYQSLEILKEAYFKLNREQDVIRTSKRIAEAYVMMGQLSSAILEYESILQRFPDDPDVLVALGEIESKANSLTAHQAPTEVEAAPRAITPVSNGPVTPGRRVVPTDVDDGRQAMHKIFVEGKIISNADFEQCWVRPDFSVRPKQPLDPFIQMLADKGAVPIEKSLRILSDKGRFGYLPLYKYDNDVELARTFPPDSCLRWCVLPFDRMSKSVLVATANPFNRQAASELSEATQLRLLWFLAPPTDIMKALRKVIR